MAREYEDDDFLDSLMEDVMEDEDIDNNKEEENKDENESHNSTENESEENLEIDENDRKIDESDKDSPVKRKRKGGLLGSLGKKVEPEDESYSDKKDTNENEIDSNEDSYSDNKEVVDNNEYSHNDTKEVINNDSQVDEYDKSLDRNIDDDDDNNLEIEDPERDSIDEMLGNLGEEEEVEEARKRAELDKEVEVPLEKPGMDEVVVTSDGKTLSDMLPGMRSGKKPINKVMKDIRDQGEVVNVNGKKFSDDRYTKHVNAIEEERARDEERVSLSNKFLQRNAEFTEQEKIIMRNLGLTNNQLSNVMRSQELSKREKEEVIALGRYGSEKHFKGRRYRTTVGDSAMLEFLTRFKFANTRILRWISNEPQGRTWRKLNRLRDSGLVESKSLIGVPDLWGATPSGVAISGFDYEAGLRPMPKMFSISSNMGVNYIAACLWFNSVNVLNLDDFPAENRVISLQDDGRDRVRGEMLISEYEIRRSLGKEISPESTTMQTLGDERLYDVISANVRKEIEEWEEGGEIGDSPEMLLGNEYMWILFPTSDLTLSYHVPDLVVKRERGSNGEPKSIAVEMERHEKSNDRYDKIMLAYKLDEHLYEQVIWITPNMRVARALEQAAKEVGFERYSIIPIITETGIYDKQDIWMI